MGSESGSCDHRQYSRSVTQGEVGPGGAGQDSQVWGVGGLLPSRVLGGGVRLYLEY